MTIPNTNISFSDVWLESNIGGSPSNIGLYNIGYYSYFSGPNGSSSLTDNNWGQGESGGDDRIYGLTATTTDFKVSDFANKDYFYDQVNYKCIINVTNNLAVPIPPSTDNDIQNIFVEFKDSTNTYGYITGVIGTVPSGGTTIATDVSSPTSPLINIGYWALTIMPDPLFPVSSADLTINGVTVFIGAVVNAGPIVTIFDYNTYGTVNMGPISGGLTGFEFILTIY